MDVIQTLVVVLNPANTVKNKKRSNASNGENVIAQFCLNNPHALSNDPAMVSGCDL